MTHVLFQHRPGDAMQVTVDRNGSEQTLDVTLSDRVHGARSEGN